MTPGVGLDVTSLRLSSAITSKDDGQRGDLLEDAPCEPLVVGHPGTETSRLDWS